MKKQTQEFERFLATLYASAKRTGIPAEESERLRERNPGLIEGDASDESFRFGPYELIVELGRGGFGIVYLARDSRTGRDVALKLPMPFVLVSRSAWNRFLREGRVGETLDHPGIVKVLETGDFGGIAYIASEYVPGPTLSSWLADRKSPVTPGIAAMLVAQLADALAHAHQKGVIHRDLKPSNVIMKPDSRSGGSGSGLSCPYQPCVTDFGLAKVLNEIRDEQTLTGSAEIGSTAYMAPEQAMGLNEAIGPCTDIHALGAILYRILAGDNPFSGTSREEVLRKIANELPTPLRTIRPDIPEQLETICEICLRKDPKHRYASAEEFKADLERFLVHEKILARPIPLWQRTRDWMQRHPALTAAGVSGLSFLVAIIWILAVQNSNLRRINHELERSERRAEEQARLAERRKSIVDRSFYETRLDSAQKLVTIGQVERAQKVLTEIDPGPGHRDFAWNHLWMRSREHMEVLAFAQADLRAMTIAPDGSTAATIDRAGVVTIRDVSTGNEIDRFELPGQMPEFVRFARDGQRLLIVARTPPGDTGAAGREFVFVVREKGASRIATIRPAAGENWGDFVEAAACDRLRFLNDRGLARAHGIGFLSLNDMRLGRETIDTANAPIRLMPDGLRVLIADKAGMLRIASIDSQAESVPLVPMREVLPNSIAIDQNSRRMAILGKNGRSIRLLNLATPAAGQASVHELPFIADSCTWVDGLDRILVHDRTNAMALIDPHSGAAKTLAGSNMSDRQPTVLESSSNIRGVAIGNSLLTFGHRKSPGGRINQLWDLESGKGSNFPFPEPIDDAWLVPDRNSAVMLTKRSLKRWWPGGRGFSHRFLPGHSDEAWGACFSPDGTLLVTSSDDTDDPMTLRIWDWGNGRLIRGFAPHKATVSCVEFSPDGRILATSALGKSANLTFWNAATGSKITDLEGHSTTIYNIAFCDDGTRLASGDNSGIVIVWDVATGEIVSKLKADSDRIRGLDFMRGSRTLVATASESRHVRIWDTVANQLIHDWTTGGEMTALALVPNARWVCAAESSGRLFVWDSVTGDLVRAIESDGSRIRHLDILPGTSYVAAGDDHGKLHLWNVQTGVEILNVKGHGASINRVACSPDGRTIATVAHDGSVRLWFGHDLR